MLQAGQAVHVMCRLLLTVSPIDLPSATMITRLCLSLINCLSEAEVSLRCTHLIDSEPQGISILHSLIDALFDAIHAVGKEPFSICLLYQRPSMVSFW